MQIFETLLLTGLAALLLTVHKPEWAPASQWLLLVALALSLANGVFEVWRWPILFAYLSLALLVWLLVMRGQGAIPLGWSAATLLPVALALLLLKGLPLPSPVVPEGPFLVGIAEFFLEDDTRLEHVIGSSPIPRSLYVKVWYPGERGQSTEAPKAAGRWEELVTQPQFRALGLLLGFISKVDLPVWWNLQPAVTAEPHPVLVYNHALVSYPSENSLLLEHLASHGYVIFSVSHVNQMAAYRNMAGKARESATAEQVLARIAATDDPLEKAGLSLEYYAAAETTNALVESRMRDTRYLLDSLQSGKPGSGILERIVEVADLGRVGAFGHSLGGAISTELCKADERCRAVANLDGGAFGLRQSQPLQVPCLMLSNALSADLNEHQRQQAQASYYDYVFRATRHGDFTDQGLLLPLYRWLGLLGKADAAEVLTHKKRLTLGFFDLILKASGDVTVLEPDAALMQVRLSTVGGN